MRDWKRCTLKDLGEIVGGATPSTKNESFYGGEIAWITPKDLSIFHGRFICQGERNITTEGLKNCSTRLMPPHSVLFTSRAPIGYVAITENEACTNQGFKSIVPNDDTDYLFLYYLLVHNRDRIENMGSGTTFKEVSGTVMKQIEVFVPSDKAEQRAIAETLGTLDDKIENNTKINHHLEQMAQVIFKSWFVDFEPFGGIMPDDWQEGTIADTCSTIFNGGTPRRNEPTFWEGTIPWLTSGEVRQAIIIKPESCISEVGLKGSSAKWVPSLSTVVALYGATAGQVSMAATPLTTNQAVTALVPKENCTYYNYLVMQYAVSQLENNAIGSAQQNISKAIVEKTACLIPADTVLAEFDKLVSPFFNDWIQNLFESSYLAALRDTLIPRLISGELTVADVEAK